MTDFNIQFSLEALKQYQLIRENDFSLTGKFLRVQISGKKCEGFTYDIGFDAKKENDTLIETPSYSIIMQPFTAKFCKNLFIDYHFDPETETEGFSITNNEQDQFRGKFFKDLDFDL